MKGGFGKDFYRKGNSVKRCRTLKIEKLLSKSTSQKSTPKTVDFDSVFDFLGPRAERPQELIFGVFFQLCAQRAQMTPVAGPTTSAKLKVTDLR